MPRQRGSFDDYPVILRDLLAAVIAAGYIHLPFRDMEEAERHRSQYLGMRSAFMEEYFRPEEDRLKVAATCTAVVNGDLWVFNNGATRKRFRERWRLEQEYRNRAKRNEK